MEGRASSSSPSLTRLLTLLLYLSHLLSSLAIPDTGRTFNAEAEATSSLDLDLPLSQEEGYTFDAGEEGLSVEGRMDMEEGMDYPGAGANKHHDPKSPLSIIMP
ncbi:hypothetical protein SAY87_018643 [Trapa incisa]|uniref:Uncharacterized protein n=2 Tax=Trapa TaxID=22665 RepID=A0AAN7M7W8_TRANT|nr:hypothetical protein SAY87_018643 [Trapa incisa]KAK4793118.1 hypothetical protein SAY86_023553 [Trapa natans]